MQASAIRLVWSGKRALLRGTAPCDATIADLSRRLGDRYKVEAHGFPDRKVIRIRPRRGTPAISPTEAAVIADTVERYLLIPALEIYPALIPWEPPSGHTAVAALSA